MAPDDGDRGGKRRGGSGDQATRLVSGETSEQTAASAEITITSFHASRVGGGILIGRDAQGALRRAVLSQKVAVRDPEPGETWRITGAERTDAEYGLQIHAEVALPLLPSGKAIIRYLATNKRFAGIGWATANRLWDALGDRVYVAIQNRDFAAIAEVIGPERAVHVVQGFGLLADEVEVFRWLDRYGVSPRTAATAAALWGRAAIQKIEADPYVLTLLEPWRSVDERALRLGVGLTDRRRLLAAVEEAFARRFAVGHTAATKEEIVSSVRPFLGPRAAVRASGAVEESVAAGRVIRHPDGLLQSRAVWFMEREIERKLGDRLRRGSITPPETETMAAIAAVEAAGGYTLTPRQREAVYMAVSCALSVVSGGAGTGKTTVVKAILEASERRRNALSPDERADFEYPQVALAGRAVKRIAEATGREASTIARFLKQIETGRRALRRGLLIFDESSMLDVRSIYRSLVALPDLVDLLFIGDPGQLPPIGPGLVFHRMVEAAVVPQVRLDVIHRQSEATGIPAVANEIRHGRLPSLPSFSVDRPLVPGVFLVAAASEAEIGKRTVEIFSAMAGSPPPANRADALHAKDIQILCPTKNRAAGFKAINRVVERQYMAHQPRIHDWGLSVGSKVMWLRNDYSKAPIRDEHGNALTSPITGDPICAGFMNGALGLLRHATERGAWVAFDDGSEDEIRPFDLERLTLGWAISVHKSQGSAFRRVIVPLGRSRLLDRALVYTAITRAVETVVLVGDPDLLRTVIEAPPRAYTRRVTLSLDGLLDGA